MGFEAYDDVDDSNSSAIETYYRGKFNGDSPTESEQARGKQDGSNLNKNLDDEFYVEEEEFPYASYDDEYDDSDHLDEYDEYNEYDEFEDDYYEYDDYEYGDDLEDEL